MYEASNPGFASGGSLGCTLLLMALSLLVGACRLAQQTGGGAVASATPEASQAGREILQAGGNAVDAAVAVSFALAATEPAGSGLGGQSSFLIHTPGRPPVAVNGTSFAPGDLPGSISADDLSGARLSTIPSTVRVLDFAWRHYGSGRIPWRRLLQPAIRRAEEGFVMGRFRHKAFDRLAEELARDPSTGAIFLPAGRPPRLGGLFRQPLLARTLRRLAEGGADEFYRGEMARQIDADMRVRGGWVTSEDLAWLPEPAVLEPVHTTFRDWDVYSLPPPAGGWVVLQVLNLIERGPPEVREDSPQRWFYLADALRLGLLNRRQAPIADALRHPGDLQRQLDKSEAARLAQEIPLGSGETTHFSVVDGQGMAVGVTASINGYFGARVAHPELGFLYNDYMREYELSQPEHPFALRPRAMPYSSMCATILARDGLPRLVLGGPGSSRIISSVVQVVQRWVDLGQGIQEAVAAPRLHVAPDRDLYLESERMRQTLFEGFQRRGFEVRPQDTGLGVGGLDPYYGGVHAVAWEEGQWVGAVDPRRDGVVR